MTRKVKALKAVGCFFLFRTAGHLGSILSDGRSFFSDPPMPNRFDLLCKQACPEKAGRSHVDKCP